MFRYLLIVTLFLFLSIIISISLASRLTIPIINLISASEKISSGDLNAKVPKKTAPLMLINANPNAYASPAINPLSKYSEKS